MRRHVVRFLAAIVILAIAAPVPAQAEPPATRNVVLIGWDGAQRNHVKECLERGELPNLKKLSSEGALVDIDIVQGLGATDTKAGWTQILTGYKPEATGVYSNGRFQPVPEGYTIFERLRGQFGADKIATVAVIGKKQHCGEAEPPKKVRLDQAGTQPASQPVGKGGKKGKARAQPGAGKGPADKIIEENGVQYRVTPGQLYCNTAKNVDVWEYGLMLDDKVGARAIELLDKYKDKPLFFFVHFAEVDHKGHQKGENSKEYNDALISNDTWTGKIIDKLKELGLYDKTLVYVTADHGFDEDKTSHHNAPYVFLGTNDKGVIRAGTRIDIAPTVLERFGVDLAKLQPPVDGHSLTKPAPASQPSSAPAAKKGGKKAGAKAAA